MRCQCVPISSKPQPLPRDHGASCSPNTPLLCPWAAFLSLLSLSWAISLPLSGTTYPVALGLVPASVAKDAGWGFQWGGQGLSEAAGDLLDEAQCSDQGQGTNFSPGSGFPGAALQEGRDWV